MIYRVLICLMPLCTQANANPREPDFNSQPTAQCRNGAYSYSGTRSGTCSRNGGVDEWSPEVCWRRVDIEKPSLLWLKSGDARCRYVWRNAGFAVGIFSVKVANDDQFARLSSVCPASFCGKITTPHM